MKNTLQDEQYAYLFREAFKALGVTPSEVAAKLGVVNTKLYNIVNGKGKPGYETIYQILKAYPRLNANYILKGELPILHESSSKIVGGSLSFVNLPLFTPTVNYKEMQEATYPILLNGRKDLTDSVVVEMTDNSMSPRYPAGTLLLAAPVHKEDWPYLNSAVVVVLYRTTLVVRRIRENDLTTDRKQLTLYADAPDSGYVRVAQDDLRSIWRVKEVLGAPVD